MENDNSTKPHMSGSISGIRIAIPLLSLAGTGISGYLTYIHYQNLRSICLFDAKCDIVLTSVYSQIWGIPLSLSGMILYAALTILGFLSLDNKLLREGFSAIAVYTLSLSGTLFSIYLYYLEIFEIHAFCTWCIISSLVMFSIFGLSLANLKNTFFISGN